MTGQVDRCLNHRTTAKNHRIVTSSTNKTALSAYDDKRFICENGIDTLPFGHYRLELQQFYLPIENSPNWGETESNESVSGKSYLQDIIWSDWSEEQPSTPEESDWSPPDPGLARTSAIREEDLDSDDVVDFSEEDSEEEEIERNPFILDEAEEDEESGSYSEREPLRKKRKK